MSTAKIALLTGGSRGLGKDMALKLAQQGIDVILTYRSQQAEAAAVVAAIEALGRRAVALPLNVADTSTFETFFTQVTTVLADTFSTGNVDFLINNAGTGLILPFAETTEAQVDELLNQHFKGVYFLTQRALRHHLGGRPRGICRQFRLCERERSPGCAYPAVGPGAGQPRHYRQCRSARGRIWRRGHAGHARTTCLGGPGHGARPRSRAG
jgi:NAD(P)-dependent dehydrogenase (short-subunit alcohol dehydrogenase family)